MSSSTPRWDSRGGSSHHHHFWITSVASGADGQGVYPLPPPQGLELVYALPGHWGQCACLLADTHLLRDVRCWQCYTRALWRLLVPTDFSLSGSVKQVNYSTWINNAREQVILFLKGAGEFVISNRGGLLWSTLCLLERTSDLRVCLWGRLLGSNWTKRIRYKTSMKKN